MNYNYRVNPNMNYRPGRPMPIPDNDDRLLGGFAFPFLLGGVTGAALAPNFWRPNYGYRPYYPPYPPYPYPYYGPYYR